MRSTMQPAHTLPATPSPRRRVSWPIGFLAGTLLVVAAWGLILLGPWRSLPGAGLSFHRTVAAGAASAAKSVQWPTPKQQGAWSSFDESVEMLDLPEQAQGPTFTPETMIAAEQRSAAVPNPAGTAALFTISRCAGAPDRCTHKKALYLYSLTRRRAALVDAHAGVGNPHWLSADEFLYTRTVAEQNVTELVARRFTDRGVAPDEHVAAAIPAPLQSIKLRALEEGKKVALVVAAWSTPSGALARTWGANDESKQAVRDAARHAQGLSTGRLYDAAFVRHWDEWLGLERNALFYGLLQRHDNKWGLSALRSVLGGTDLESPIPPWPGPQYFDVGRRGVTFVAKDPSLDPAWNTRCHAYYLPLPDFGAARPGPPRQLAVDGLDGAATSPIFSPDGAALAWLQMRENGYESDRNRLLVVRNATHLESDEFLRTNVTGAVEYFAGEADGAPRWDRSPSVIVWSGDGQALHLAAESHGVQRIFNVQLDREHDLQSAGWPAQPSVFGSAKDMRPLAADSQKLLVTSSSFVDDSLWSVLDPAAPDEATLLSSHTRNGSVFGLSPEQVSEAWFDGAAGRRIHAWVLVPSTFRAEESQKYPLALVIHGGPQGSWTTSWSIRWNAAMFAEQGYIAVLPDPTGSTGYGTELEDAIQGDWGGAPYEDLVACMDYITGLSQSTPGSSQSERAEGFHLAHRVDTDRMVALGASYGGFMINWINGHDLGKRFQALVCHDGAFSIPGQLASDEMYFPTHEFQKTYWENPAGWTRWDPGLHVGNWSTPTLVIHSVRDYRLLIGEGLAAFNALQRRGVRSRFLAFPDEGHWVESEGNSRAWHATVLQWINSAVGLPHSDAGVPIVLNPRGHGEVAGEAGPSGDVGTDVDDIAWASGG